MIRDYLEIIIGQCIGHGYNDANAGLQEPTKECKRFAEDQLYSLIQVFKEHIEEIEKQMYLKEEIGNWTFSVEQFSKDLLEGLEKENV